MFWKISSVLNLAYSKKLVLLYKYLSNMECHQYSGAALQIIDNGRDVYLQQNTQILEQKVLKN